MMPGPMALASDRIHPDVVDVEAEGPGVGSLCFKARIEKAIVMPATAFHTRLHSAEETDESLF
jgi:hypothetical protein